MFEGIRRDSVAISRGCVWRCLMKLCQPIGVRIICSRGLVGEYSFIDHVCALLALLVPCSVCQIVKTISIQGDEGAEKCYCSRICCKRIWSMGHFSTV